MYIKTTYQFCFCLSNTIVIIIYIYKSNYASFPTRIWSNKPFLLWNHSYSWELVNISLFIEGEISCVNVFFYHNARQSHELLNDSGGVNSLERKLTKSPDIDLPWVMMNPQYYICRYPRHNPFNFLLNLLSVK